MRKQRRIGFTLVEMMITLGSLAVLMAMAFTPLAGSLAQTQRETSMLTMDLSAKRSFSRVKSLLGQALLPIATYPEHAVPVAKNSIATFQDLVNSGIGFGTHGSEWSDILAGGADFVPFAVPVDYGGDGDTLDSQLAMELGIVLPDGRVVTAGSYLERVGENILDGEVGSLHPTLASLTPADFGDDVAGDDGLAVDLSQPRFLRQPVFNPDQGGFGVLRFVPIPKDHGDGWVTLDERELTEKSDGITWDLNNDGLAVDVYALGRLELTFVGPEGAVTNIPVSGPDILLQLNRDSPSWKPLFRLVRQGAKDAAVEDGVLGSIQPEAGGYALLINLLMFDRSWQSGAPLAFNAKLPYLVRRHQTMIELRNMSNATLLKLDE